MRGGATFDATGTYRYYLWREWDASLPAVTFVMLNPSTADAERDDPTIRRCIGFARAWGYGRLEVANLFAYRAASPRELLAAAEPIGSDNEYWLRRAADTKAVVVAWGDHGRGPRAKAFQCLDAASLRCLGLTARGEPRHPLYVPRGRIAERWLPAEARDAPQRAS
jgi:hypothetical protein